MKTRIYYHFKKSIKGRIKYMKQMEDYFTYKELYKQTEYKLLLRLPLTTLMLWIINLPTNILNYLYYLKDRRDYERAVVDVEIMKKYIDVEDKKEKLNRLKQEYSELMDEVTPLLVKSNILLLTNNGVTSSINSEYSCFNLFSFSFLSSTSIYFFIISTSTTALS